MLDKFAKELKEAREKTDITLENLSARSRLDIKFLQSMEKGDFSFLPELYVKAFIKDYAKLIGLDVNETIKKYEAAKKGLDYSKTKDEPEPEEEKESDSKEEEEKIEDKEKLYGEQKNKVTQKNENQTGNWLSFDKGKIKLIALIMGVIIIAVVAFFIFSSNNEPEIIVKEKPYEEVRKENQQRFIEEKSKNDAIIKKNASTLSLVISSTDTSWIKVQADSNKPLEYMLYPGSKINVTSEKKFLIIIGNSGGISIKLNDNDLGFTGKEKLVKYLLITKDGINYLNTEPAFTNN